MNNRHNLAAEPCRRALGVMPLGDDPIEELAAGAQLHHQMHVVPILEHLLELHYVAVSGEVVHDLDFAADVGDVVGADELARGY